MHLMETMGPAVHSVVLGPLRSRWELKKKKKDRQPLLRQMDQAGGGNSLCRFNPIIDIRKGIIIMAKDCEDCEDWDWMRA